MNSNVLKNLAFAMLGTLWFCTGCGQAGGLHPVTGKVTYIGGGVPQGEVAIVQFEPIEGTTAPGEKKGATGTIQPDGSYQLTTLEQNDGAYAGEYKVIFSVRKSYAGQDSLVDAKFMSPKTTPAAAKVTPQGPNHFDFEIAKAPGT